MLIAIPSDAPGGLDARVSDHFGHCHTFTLIQVDDGRIGDVALLQNGGHEQGGCLVPVSQLQQRGVEALVAGGMGARPLAGFQQAGITVYFKEDAATVGEAVQGVIDGTARVFGPAQTCGGHGGHGHGHDGRHQP
jgi:predicted Fe-Mo cluster-binding NifX family protein